MWTLLPRFSPQQVLTYTFVSTMPASQPPHWQISFFFLKNGFFFSTVSRRFEAIRHTVMLRVTVSKLGTVFSFLPPAAKWIIDWKAVDGNVTRVNGIVVLASASDGLSIIIFTMQASGWSYRKSHWTKWVLPMASFVKRQRFIKLREHESLMVIKNRHFSFPQGIKATQE